MSSKNSKIAKPKRSKSKRGRNKNVTKTKVVVRRLPPLIPENLFFETVKQWVNEETCTWSRFHQGRISKSKNKESIFSRAYFHFKTVEQVLDFHRGYDNHLFIDKQGNENRAVVEFAIYQKLPKEHKKPDPRQGTIESDPDYLSFLESLKAEEIQQVTAKEPGAALESGATQLERLETRLANAVTNVANVVEKPTTTPLLEHLRALKLGPKSKSPPPRQAQMAILSPPGLSPKGSGSKTQKQSQQTRAIQANETSQFTQSIYKPTKRERKKRERERERREREKEKREKDKEKDRKIEEEYNKDTEKEKDRESEEVDIEKSREKTKEQGKDHRERKREKKSEKERQKSIREKEKKPQATEASKPEPTITIVPRPQTEELKAEAKEKEKEKEKETKRAPVKITIQQRQKEQIRQFIQKTSPSLKKELITTENELKETTSKESVADQKDIQKEEDKEKDISAESSSTSKGHSSTSSTSNAPLPNESRYRRRDRIRKHSTDVKPPVQIQILTKSQTQSNTSDSNVTTSTSPNSTTTPPPIRRTGRGYFGKRGGRW